MKLWLTGPRTVKWEEIGNNQVEETQMRTEEKERGMIRGHCNVGGEIVGGGQRMRNEKGWRMISIGRRAKEESSGRDRIESL